MKKIRINELARELEVKPGVILDLLPEFGVQEKKTHSSSIEEDVADAVRYRITGIAPQKTATPPPEAPAPAAPPATELQQQPVESEEAAASSAEAGATPSSEAAAAPVPPSSPAPAVEAAPHPVEQPAAPPATAAAAIPVAREEQAAGAESAAPKFQPVRPPIGRGAIHPPLAPSGSGNRTVAIPARPLPTTPKPGVPIPPSSGPRQPFPEPARPPVITPERFSRATPAPPPPAAAAPAAPVPPQPPQAKPHPPTHIVVPGPPAPASAVPGPPLPRPAPSRPAPGLAPGTPIAPRPAGRSALTPPARPTVPPRPDLEQRLRQQQAKPAATPGMPKPGVPARPPIPGQPLVPAFRGPVRPGQPVRSSSAGTAPPAQARRPATRAPHPTTPLREPVLLPPDQRRHQAKPPARQPSRKREELEEGVLPERVTKRPTVTEPPPIDREITISEGITVKELSEKLGVKANLVIKKLLEKNIFASINQTLDVKLAEEVAREFGASTNQVTYEEESTQEIELATEPQDLVRRAPVVTVMGHVDHGKTSLLDAIRQSNVAAREAGGITQHIGAYRVEKNGRKIVFIDTPGHEAFTRMRARGAKVTDIVVLVVSADDGVMPQTLEAIDHARAAGVPIIVAINKIDKPDAQPERVKQQLADRGLLAEDWGGDVVMVPVSAKTGQNLDLLLEMILLVADMQELKANPNRPAIGTVLEAKLDRGRGPVATILVRNGTLRTGDYFLCGTLFGKVRAMFDDRGNQVKEAEPAMPVEVIGFESLPEVGDTFQVASDPSKAKQIMLYRESKAREAAMAKGARVASLDTLHQHLKEGEIKDLNLIIKADVGGTAEVLSDTLQRLSNDKVRVRVLHAGVGAITESDVLLASASDAIIIGFNVRPERSAQATAEQQKVDIRLHTIIYELIDEVKMAMTGLLEPVFKETVQGHAEVRQTFRISKVGTVAGCYVEDGFIRRDSQVRVLRNGDVIHTGRIETLKRFKNDASEVKSGLECGISIANFNDIQVGDRIEAFVMERVAPEVPVA
jgi:translation initiation factor IF-2